MGEPEPNTTDRFTQLFLPRLQTLSSFLRLFFTEQLFQLRRHFFVRERVNRFSVSGNARNGDLLGRSIRHRPDQVSLSGRVECAEELGHGEVWGAVVAELAEELDGEEGVAAELEEVVVDANSVDV